VPLNLRIRGDMCMFPLEENKCENSEDKDAKRETTIKSMRVEHV